MIKIELTFTSVAEAAAFLAGRSGNEPVATATTASPGASAASSTKPAASAGKAKPEADKPKETKVEKTKDEAPAGIDYDTEVKPVVNTVASMAEGSGGGRAVVLALLKEFGAAKGSEVKAEDLPAFKAKLEEIIANESVA